MGLVLEITHIPSEILKHELRCSGEKGAVGG